MAYIHLLLNGEQNEKFFDTKIKEVKTAEEAKDLLKSADEAYDNIRFEMFKLKTNSLFGIQYLLSMVQEHVIDNYEQIIRPKLENLLREMEDK